MVGLPVTFSFRLKTDFVVSSQLEDEVAPPVQVSQFLELLPYLLGILHQRDINQVVHQSSLADIESLERLASVKLSINEIPFHSALILVDILKLVSVAGDFSPTAHDDAVVLIAMVAAGCAVFVPSFCVR